LAVRQALSEAVCVLNLSTIVVVGEALADGVALTSSIIG
jgi:hypothetical protein